MMIGHVKQPAFAVVFVTSNKVILRGDGHIRGRHRNVLIAGNISPRRIIDLIVGSPSDGKSGDVALAMVKYSIDVGREHRLVCIVHFHGRIGPPEERLRKGGPVV